MSGAKLSACLAKISLRLHPPHPEDSDVSFIQLSGTPRENLAPVEPESSVQICPFEKSQLNSSPLVQEAGGEIFSIVRTIARIVIQSQVQSEVLGR